MAVDCSISHTPHPPPPESKVFCHLTSSEVSAGETAARPSGAAVVCAIPVDREGVLPRHQPVVEQNRREPEARHRRPAVCVCVCVRARARACVCVRACVHVFVWGEGQSQAPCGVATRACFEGTSCVCLCVDAAPTAPERPPSPSLAVQRPRLGPLCCISKPSCVCGRAVCVCVCMQRPRLGPLCCITAKKSLRPRPFCCPCAASRPLRCLVLHHVPCAALCCPLAAEAQVPNEAVHLSHYRLRILASESLASELLASESLATEHSHPSRSHLSHSHLSRSHLTRT